MDVTGRGRAGLLALFGLLAAAPAAGAAQVADVTVAYEMDYSSVEDEVHTPGTSCTPWRGTINRTSTTKVKTVMRGRLHRYPVARGQVYGLIPVRPTLSRPFLPLTPRYQSTTVNNVEEFFPNEDYEGTGCAPGNWRRSPEPAEPPTACRIPGGLLFQEQRGRILATFGATNTSNCDGDGYPGTTNYLRPYARISPARLGSVRTNRLAGQASKRTQTREPGARSNVTTTRVDTARWTLTLVRTSGWRTSR
jgi:hypothetical protein